MMNSLGIDVKVTVNKDELLNKLITNRELHQKLVTEAKAGYLAAAKKALEIALAAIEEGKPVPLTFTLKVPKSFVTVYDTMIEMLRAHTGETIEISADTFRHLGQDEWDWTRDFLGSNAVYSSGTRAWSVSKGFDIS